MSSPNPFPCGGVGQRPCPPTNAAAIHDLPTAHASAVLALLNEYGQQCYEKGLNEAMTAYQKSHGHEGAK